MRLSKLYQIKRDEVNATEVAAKENIFGLFDANLSGEFIFVSDCDEAKALQKEVLENAKEVKILLLSDVRKDGTPYQRNSCRIVCKNGAILDLGVWHTKGKGYVSAEKTFTKKEDISKLTFGFCKSGQEWETQVKLVNGEPRNCVKAYISVDW